MLTDDFGAGFADPVRDAQANFRAILDALARPGTIHQLACTSTGVASLTAELAAILLTLADHDTPLFVSPRLDDAAVHGFVGFHTGAPLTSDMSCAAFAFVAPGDALPDLAGCNLGTQDYPDRSTTLVVAVPALTLGPDRVLTGPGIEDHWHIAPQGLPDDFTAQWAANRDLFPRGIDLLLVAGGQVMGLPRTTRISEGH